MPYPPRTAFAWRLRTRSLVLGQRTRVMGVLNVTPDSFSDGGLHASVERSVEHGLSMLDEGADILDLGGESTRPGATAISADEEQARILPVVDALLKERPETILSIDTYHAATARAAAAAEIVNDVSGLLWDAAMAEACAQLSCGVVLSHTRGRPKDWAVLPSLPPVAVMPVVLTGLRDSLLAARTAGVASDRIVLDPGFGFGKRGEENFVIHAMLERMHQFGLPVMVGTSRKGFLRAMLASDQGVSPGAASRGSVRASAASIVAAVLAGAHLVRVHDIHAMREAIAVADAILEAAAAIDGVASSFSPWSSSVPQ